MDCEVIYNLFGPREGLRLAADTDVAYSIILRRASLIHQPPITHF